MRIRAVVIAGAALAVLAGCSSSSGGTAAAGYRHYVRVIGYPSSADAPVDCQNWTSEQSPAQLKFACQDFTGGTSGSPWLTGYDAQTRTGTITGVLGGYQEGGDTPDVSYSAYLNDDIKKLYDQAISG